MNVQQIFTEVRKRAVTDAIDYPNADMFMLINSRIRELHGITTWNWLHREQSFVPVIAAFEQIIPFDDIGDIDYIRLGTSVRRLKRTDRQVFFGERPDAATASQSQGTPWRYVPLGESPVSAQPASALALEILSTDAADTTQTVTVTATVGGAEITTTRTLNGTTAVAMAMGNATRVSAFVKSATTAGIVKLRTVVGSVVLGQINTGDLESKYQVIGLDSLPATADLITVGYYRRTMDLTVLTETPPLPQNRHNLLVYGCLADILAFEDDDAGYLKFEGKWKAGVMDLLKLEKNPADKRSQFRVAGELMRSRIFRKAGRVFGIRNDVDLGY